MSSRRSLQLGSPSRPFLDSSQHDIAASTPNLPERFTASTSAEPDTLAGQSQGAVPVQQSLFGLIAVAQPLRELIDTRATPPQSPDDDLVSEDEDPATVASMCESIRDIRQSPKPAISSGTASTITLDPQSNPSAKIPSASRLPQALQHIFHFEQVEEVMSEHPCWYLQNALLQGFMYITTCHICFYAYLPHKQPRSTKAGYLSKRNKSASRYARQYFTLRGTVLSYYANDSVLYYPLGNIDLRKAVSAQLDTDPNAATFTLISDNRTFHFMADTPHSAREWTKTLQAVIDRSRNDAYSVKISLPIDNILDIQSCPVIDAADTVRIRVIDNDDTFAIDEYFFSFFDTRKQALAVLEEAIARSSAAKALDSSSQVLIDDDDQSRSAIFSGRPSRLEASSRPHSSGIESSTKASEAQLETVSDRSSEDSQTGEEPSASIMLSQDDAFHSPTLRSDKKSRKDLATEIPQDQMQELQLDVTEPSRPQTPSQTTSRDEKQRQAIKRLPTDTTYDQTYPRPRQHRAPSYTESMTDIVRTGTLSLLRAHELTATLKAHSKRVSTLVGTSSRGYYEKVYGMWAGGKKHYSDADGLQIEDHVTDLDEQSDTLQAESRFREYFALPASEKLIASFFGHLLRVLPLYGKLYVGTTRLCFRSLLPGTRTKLVLPFADIMTIDKELGFRFGYAGMVIVIKGHAEIFFEFASNALRDDCTVTLLKSLDTLYASTVDERDELSVMAAKEHALLQGARAASSDMSHSQLLDQNDYVSNDPFLSPTRLDTRQGTSTPSSSDGIEASVLDFKPTKSLRITCLTIGSRGDVQPYIALCKGLLAEGHFPRIATHKEFEPWVRKHGIDFARVDGDPAELMRICVENGMFTPSFLWEANYKFRGFLETLLSTAWSACQGTDLLIESPSAMAGIHIAEALQIPYFRAFTMPWTRTRAYPHAFAVPSNKMGGAYNYMTYVFFDNIFWQSTAGQINRWRRKELGLRPTGLDRLQPNKVPFLYNFSPSVVMPPLDFSDWIRVTGYWFLDEGDVWDPPAALVEFISKAKEDKVPIVYIGFGSIVVRDSRAMTRAIVAAVQKADVRCILSKGWSDRLNSSTSSQPVEELPSCILPISSAPHDWLFAQMDCVIHHGGAGTTGASLRAGVPTLITPFFGDQFFFANRVQDLGVGLHVAQITEACLGKALWIGTHDGRMRSKAAALGEAIRQEDGVGTAIKALWRDLDYANTLIKRPVEEAKGQDVQIEKEKGTDGQEVDDDEELDETAGGEESWTFVENEDDPADLLISTRSSRAPSIRGDII